MARVHVANTLGQLHRHRFWADYTVPLVLSVAFLFIVLGVAGIRIYQQTALTKLLAQVSVLGRNYTALLSDDQTSPGVRNTDNTLNNPASGTAQIGSFSVAPSSTGSGGTGTTPTPTQPFTASITVFKQGATALECTSQQQNKSKCSKRYSFSATVEAQHGPGTVQYGWRSNWQAANFDGSYTAGSGTTQNTILKTLLIPCLNPGSYNVQFVITTPAQIQSSIITFNHDCVGV